MGTWSTTEPTNLATSWTKVGDTGAINCYYCIRYRQDGAWHNSWFYYVMKVVGYLARTSSNQAVQKIELYVNDGNTDIGLSFFPVATDSTGEVVGEDILNSPHTSSLTHIATRYYTTTNGTTPDTLTFGVYTVAYKSRGPNIGSVGNKVRINATVSGSSPVIKGAIPWFNYNGVWKQSIAWFNQNGNWKQSVAHYNNSGEWK